MKKAFTLAEILITLSIIGVIASMTIPSLVQDIQDAQYKTAWKKEYSDLDQVTRRIKLDYGGGFKTSINTARSLYPIYKKYFNYIKDCGYTGCYYTDTNPPILRLNGTEEDWHIFDDGQFVLNNGMFIAIENPSVGYSDPLTILWVDVNGYPKGPNIIGKDIFGAKLSYNGIKPLGSQGDGYENTCSTSSSGWGCSAKYLYQ